MLEEKQPPKAGEVLDGTVMVSDPIMSRHCRKVYFKEVFEEYKDTFANLGVVVNNGLGDVYKKIANLPEAESTAIEQDILAPTRRAAPWRRSTPFVASRTRGAGGRVRLLAPALPGKAGAGLQDGRRPLLPRALRVLQGAVRGPHRAPGGTGLRRRL